MRRRLKHVADLRAGGTPDTDEPAYWGDDGGIPWVSIGDMSGGGTVTSTAKSVTIEGLASRRLPLGSTGTVLLAMYATIGATATLGMDATWNQAILGITPSHNKADARFLRYWLEAVRPEWGALVRSNTQDNLNAEVVGNVRVPDVSVVIQRAIADYLDAATARIDHALGALRRSVVLLHERRRSLISEVFAEPLRTGRGTTVRAIADPLLGRQRSPEHASGPRMVRYLRAANVKDGRLELEDVMEMNFTPAEQQIFALQPGDVLITEGAGSLAAVGANAVWRGELDGTVCFQNTLVRLRPVPGSEPRYVAWWARFAYESGLFRAAASGANIYHLGVETIRTLPAWAPDRTVQTSIADLLDREIGAIEVRVRFRERQIDLLLERRQALITAAVTCQIEIPGVAA